MDAGPFLFLLIALYALLNSRALERRRMSAAERWAYRSGEWRG